MSGSAGLYLNPTAPSSARAYVDELVSNSDLMREWGVASVMDATEAEAEGGWRGAYKVLPSTLSSLVTSRTYRFSIYGKDLSFLRR